MNDPAGSVMKIVPPAGEALRSFAGAGDVDWDGVPDVVVGVPTQGGPNGATTGAAYVVGGEARGEVLLADGDQPGSGVLFPIWGAAPGTTANALEVATGAAVAAAGDLDGDGRADLAIGAPGTEGAAGQYASGAAYVVFGQASTAPIDAAALRCGQGARIRGYIGSRGLGGDISASSGAFGADPEVVVGAGSPSPESVGGFVRAIPLGDVAGACEAAEPPTGGGDNPEVDWGFREGFRRYVYNGFDPAAPAVPIAASNGAFCPVGHDAARGGCDPHLKAPADPVRRDAFRFTPIGAGATDGSDTTVATIGRITFRYPGHFFTLRLEDPWFTVQGGKVTVKARMDLDVDPGLPAYQSADVRVDLGTFPLEGPAEVTSPYVKWKTGAGVLTAAAGAALGGFLGIGAELDPIALTIPRGIAALPAEPGAPAAPDPVEKPGVNVGLGDGGASAARPGAASPPAVSLPLRGRAVGEGRIARVASLTCG
ncbi:MAG: HtaA domain-containing protein [Actinobacteria bacterium]|nr:HtaA domain-containing protein [Actinomycetota bacterium]